MNFSLETLLIAFLTGMVPTFFWLWFWLSNDRKRPEPKFLLVSSFLIGGIAVIASFFLEKIISFEFGTDTFEFTFLSSIVEEVMKFIFVALFIFPSKYVDEPIDYAIYLGTAGLGFAAFENTLFLLNPAQNGDFLRVFLVGNSRFIGATVLHAVTTILIGAFIAKSHTKATFSHALAVCRGLLLAIIVHMAFNLIIVFESNITRIAGILGLWIIGIGLVHYIHIISKKYPYNLSKKMLKSKKYEKKH